MSILDSFNLISRGSGKELTSASAHFFVDKFNGNSAAVKYYKHHIDGNKELVVQFISMTHFWLNASCLFYWLPLFALSCHDQLQKDELINYIMALAFKDHEEYFSLGINMTKDHVDLNKFGDDPHIDFTVNKNDKSMWVFGYDIPKLSGPFYYNLFLFNFLIKFFCDTFQYGRTEIAAGLKIFLQVAKENNLNIFDVKHGMAAATMTSNLILENTLNISDP